MTRKLNKKMREEWLFLRFMHEAPESEKIKWFIEVNFTNS